MLSRKTRIQVWTRYGWNSIDHLAKHRHWVWMHFVTLNRKGNVFTYAKEPF